MRRLSVPIVQLLILTVTAAAPAAAQRSSAAPADSGLFVVLHGTDTVAQERFTRTETELRGRLILTEAAHGVQQYKAVIAPDASVPLIEVSVRVYRDSADTAGRIAQRARVIFKDDSAAVDALTDHGIETRLFETRRGAIPYLNLSFALLEQAVRRVRNAPASSGDVPFFNLGGGETAVGKVRFEGAESAVVTLGDTEFHLRVDAAGRVLGGGIPVQDVIVQRY